MSHRGLLPYSEFFALRTAREPSASLGLTGVNGPWRRSFSVSAARLRFTTQNRLKVSEAPW
ncbi:hypothetical protein AKJ09_04823 [Labilithrix luteola]|uniref:Uncharacterized protein n=1 Tax=Labilithrix luteola TaxID=1391654 RepID=A0A0K1PYD8_9BACT|nr:hypothetical protein AKJ09_04823 [Labilithrix luteola]